jgi:hypothetical protein
MQPSRPGFFYDDRLPHSAESNAVLACGQQCDDRTATATRSKRMEVGGTTQQQLVFLNTHWGRRYSFTAPDLPGGQWTARPTFGRADPIQEWTATDLLHEVRRHYEANRPAIGGPDGP